MRARRMDDASVNRTGYFVPESSTRPVVARSVAAAVAVESLGRNMSGVQAATRVERYLGERKQNIRS